MIEPTGNSTVLSATRSTERAFPDLERMLVDDDGVPVPDADDTMRKRYRKLLGRTDRISLALAASAIVGSWIEWFVFSFRPLFLGSAVPGGEVDWSVAALGAGMGARALNAAFSFLAFTAQGLYIGVIVVFLVFVYVSLISCASWPTRRRRRCSFRTSTAPTRAAVSSGSGVSSKNWPFWVAFAFLSLIFYRIGTAFVLLWMWRIVRRAFKAGDPQPAPAPAGTT